MIQIKEEKIAELMFDIWHKSNDLKNPVMVGEYIAEELTKVKNLAIHDVSKSFYCGTAKISSYICKEQCKGCKDLEELGEQ